MGIAREGPRRLENDGRVLLLILFVALYAGRFTFDRLGPGFPSLEARLVPAYVAVIGYLIWIKVAYRRTSRPRLGAYGGFLASFLAWMMTSALWSAPGARTGRIVVDLAVLLVIVFLSLDIAGRIDPELRTSIWTWLIVLALLAFVSALLAGPDLQGRYAAAGGGPNVFVRHMALGALAAVHLAAVRDRVHYLWMLPLFGVGALLSGSRGGLVAIAVMAVVGAVPLLRRVGGHLRRRLLATLLSGGLIAVFIVGDRTVTFLRERYLQQTLVERYDSSRSTINSLASDLIARNPLLGAGLDGFHAQHPEWEHAHNLWLIARTEAGVIAVLLLTLTVASAMWVLWRNRPLSLEAVSFALAGGYILIAAMFSGDLYDSRFAWLFLGLAVLEAQRAPPPSREPGDAIPSTAGDTGAVLRR